MSDECRLTQPTSPTHGAGAVRLASVRDAHELALRSIDVSEDQPCASAAALRYFNRRLNEFA